MTIKDAPQTRDAHLFKAEHEPYPYEIHGLIVPMFTPVRPSGGGFEIDSEADVRLTNHLIDGGADVLFILGNAGMFQKLTPEQKMNHIDTVTGAAAQSARKVPIVVGVSSPDIGESSILARYSEERGATGIVYMPSFGSGDPATKTWNVLRNTQSIPMVFYNNPAIQEGKRSLDMSFVKKFAGHHRVIGIKNSSKDIETYEAMARQLTSPTFSVFMGEAANIVPAMQLYREGKTREFAGAVPVQANLHPEIFAHFLQKDGQVLDEQLEAFVRGNRTKTVLGDLVSMGMIDAKTLEVFSQ